MPGRLDVRRKSSNVWFNFVNLAPKNAMELLQTLKSRLEGSKPMVRSILTATIASAICFARFSSSAWASPTLKVTSTVKSVEKGGAFEVVAEVTTAEAITNIRIAALGPEGFLVEPVTTTGITASADHGPVAEIRSLPAGSAITAVFKVWAPDWYGRPLMRLTSGKLTLASKESYYPTFGGRKFNFNLIYDEQVDGRLITEYQTVALDVGYTTAIGFYIVMGMIGVLIGYIVKQSTQGRAEIMATAAAADALRDKLLAIFKYYFIQNLPSLLTLFAVGFAALITLAREGLPASSWNAAMALGIGLSVLTDDEIFGKLKGR
jgi:hypothetical protein